MQSQIRSFVFTLNNYNDESINEIHAAFHDARYLVIGREIGEECQTPHLQGYCQLAKKMSFRKVAGMFPWHIECVRGTPEEASIYCKKEGDFVEFGVLATSSNGQSAKDERWREILQMAKNNQMDELELKFPGEYIRNHKSLLSIRSANMVSLDNVKKCIWLWGRPRTGKSRFAFDFDRESCYPKMCNKWWDGYNNQKVVVMDEFGLEHKVLSHHIKRWADRHPIINEIKGTAIVANYDTLIITSNYAIETIWHDDEMLQAAIKSRFHQFEVLGHSVDPEGLVSLEIATHEFFVNKKFINKLNYESI